MDINEELLDEIERFLGEHVDIRDGSDGTARPNRAMQLWMDLKAARKPPRVERLRFQINWVKDGVHDHKMVEGSLEECQKQAQEIVTRVNPESFWSAEATI